MIIFNTFIGTSIGIIICIGTLLSNHKYDLKYRCYNKYQNNAINTITPPHTTTQQTTTKHHTTTHYHTLPHTLSQTITLSLTLPLTLPHTTTPSLSLSHLGWGHGTLGISQYWCTFSLIRIEETVSPLVSLVANNVNPKIKNKIINNRTYYFLSSYGSQTQFG